MQAFCKKCDERYPQARADLGYDLCLKCGAEDAAKMTAARKNSLVLQHKQTYVFVQSKDEVRNLNSGKVSCL